MAKSLDYLIKGEHKWSKVLEGLHNSILLEDDVGLSNRIKELIELSDENEGECLNAVFVLNRLLSDRDIKPNSERVIGYLTNEIAKGNENNNRLSLKYYTKQDLMLLTTRSTMPTAGTESVINGLWDELNPDSYKSQESISAIDTASGNGAGAIIIAKLLQCKVMALDINPNYLDVIRLNSLLNNVSGFVTPFEGSVLEPKDNSSSIKNYYTNIKVINANFPQRPVLPEESKLDLTKQYALGDDGLGFLHEMFKEGKKKIEKDGVYYVQILDWHSDREISIFAEHNLNHKLIPSSVIRKKLSEFIPPFPLSYFAKYENMSRTKFSFEDVNGRKLTAQEADKLYSMGMEVYTTFRLIRLTKN